MNSPLPAAPVAVRITFALLVIVSALVLLNRANSGSIRKTQDQLGSKAKPIERKPSRRLFENRIPEHLPIKVKIKLEKEKQFRDLNNDNWARDLELEVKNIGNKPIYFLRFLLEVPEAKIADSHQVFVIGYGRLALADLNNRPTTEDVPIEPGETKVLTIEDVGVRGWDQARDHRLVPRIHGVRVTIEDLNFGDGTGFFGKTGAPRPKPDSEPSGPASCFPAVDRYGGLKITRVIGDGISDIEDMRNSLHAGIFKPASFFLLRSIGSMALPALKSTSTAVECNCINVSCWHGTRRVINTNETNEFCYQCGEIIQFQGTQCTQPGNCFFREVQQKYCPNPGGAPFFCPNDRLWDCAETPPSPSDCPGNAPNPDCRCVKYGDVYDWDCGNCGPGSSYADFGIYPGTGCPPYATNNSNCCVCNETRDCGPFCHWDDSLCNCMTAVLRVVPVAAVTRLTRPARPMSVVQGVPAIGRPGNVCRRPSNACTRTGRVGTMI